MPFATVTARLVPAPILALTLAAALASPAAAQAPSRMKVCADQWNEMKAKNQTGDQTYQEFSKKCMSADDAPAAKPAAAPAAAGSAGSKTSVPSAGTKPATTAPSATTAKPAATPKPTAASARDDEEEGTAKEDLAKCNASWKDYKAKNNVTGAKAWHVFMAKCLP
ncbi:hypothetical protein [Ancylobacter terrae]|uniref:hypothetical protein n=1 Tax=Ancylobacter sp. sgz301288 TaxID=3342077 RepID=UPI00385E70CC